MSYATQSKSISLPIYPSDPSTATQLGQHRSSTRSPNRSSLGLPMYSQRDSLVDSLHFLSRSLTRMRIQHAVMGASAVALREQIPHSSGDRGQDIDLMMSPEDYAKFRSTWVNQRLASIESDEHQFWDNRTGYLVRIHITGAWIKTGKRAIRVPDLSTLPKTEDGIAYWIPDAADPRFKPAEERRPWEKIAPQRTIAA
jgi:hypothetical protein